jgi:tRNA 2-selenouridine synthase SelU
VVSSGIEPESRASETLILSIVLRDQMRRKCKAKCYMANMAKVVQDYMAVNCRHANGTPNRAWQAAML